MGDLGGRNFRGQTKPITHPSMTDLPTSDLTPEPTDSAYPDHRTLFSVRDAFKTVRSHVLTRWIAIAAIILLAASTARHLLLMSTAFDLGIYDQVAYLLSRGKAPISSYLGFHHMGNHSAYSFYLLAIPYFLVPSVYWLFGVQAISLALGAWPTWLLARQAGLSQALASAMAAVYLLHPIVFNVNMFDFHPEVMALSVMILLLWLARQTKMQPSRQRVWFCVALLFVLGCKASLSLTIATMGLWLLLEKRRFFGTVALIGGITWFLLTTQWIIPTLSGSEAAALGRYRELGGSSVLETALNLFLKPDIVLNKIFSPDSLQYLGLLFVPFLWGLSPRYLTPLLSTVPLMVLNMLSQNGAQRDLVHQYSLPILPFLLLAVIDSLAHGKGLLRQRRWIILWALVVFVALAKYGRYHPEYTAHLDTWRASQEALALIPRHEGGVITDNWHGAHLSHRDNIFLFRGNQTFKEDLPKASYVLINVKHPWDDDFEATNRMFERLKKRRDLKISYERDGVYLFTRQNENQTTP
jgi:uncharacterized membrane protein